MIWSEHVDVILKEGLFSDDARNWLFGKVEVIEVLGHLEAKQIGVLGGDVYSLGEGKAAPTGENWHCDQLPGEPNNAFVQRSHRIARNYVRDFPGNEKDQFALVPLVS